MKGHSEGPLGTKTITAFYVSRRAPRIPPCSWSLIEPGLSPAAAAVRHLKIHLWGKYQRRKADAVTLITCLSLSGVLLSQGKDGGRIDWIWPSALPIDLHDVCACVSDIPSDIIGIRNVSTVHCKSVCTVRLFFLSWGGSIHHTHCVNGSELLSVPVMVPVWIVKSFDPVLRGMGDGGGSKECFERTPHGNRW